MNAANDIAWVCAHQDLATALLAWFMGVVPLSSFAAWYANKMPWWLQVIVHGLAANVPNLIASATKVTSPPAQGGNP